MIQNIYLRFALLIPFLFVLSSPRSYSQVLSPGETQLFEEGKPSTNKNLKRNKLPQIQINVDTLFAEIAEGATQNLSIDILNTGDTTLFWNIQIQNSATWLSNVPPGTGAISANSQASSQMKVEAGNLVPGFYYTEAMVVSNDSSQSEIPITIQMKITDSSNGPEPELELSIGPVSFCPGEEVEVYYHLKNGAFNPDNELKIYASSANGDFSEPFLLTSVSKADTMSSVLIQLPIDAEAGNQYKLRLISNTPFYQSNDIEELTIHPLPDVQLAAFPDACINLDPFVLDQGQPVGGDYFGSGISGDVFDPSSLQPGVYTIAYIYTSPEACTVEAAGTIKVLDAPEATFPDFTSIVCDNFFPISLNTASPSGGVYSGLGVENEKFDPSIAGEGEHTIRYVFSEGGCADTVEASISVTASPEVFLLPVDVQCEGAIAVELQAGPPGGILEGPGIFNATFNPGLVGVGTHTIGYEIYDGTCAGIARIEIEVVENPPLPLISLSGEFLRLNRNYDRIEWYVNGTLIDGETGILIKPRRTGTFSVRVFEGDCFSTSEDFVFSWPTSIDKELLHAWRMYPNPANQQVTLAWDQGLFNFSSDLAFKVYDGLGKVVYEQKVGLNKAKMVLQIDQWPAGIYTVEVLSDNRRAQRRLVVEGNR